MCSELKTALVGALLALGLAASATFPPTAAGHAAFLEADPGAGERLRSGPAQITLEFTEPLDRSLSEATLVNAESGERVPSTLVEGGGEREIALQPDRRLPRGPYRVEWHTVSTVDGHALEGSFGFGVRAPPAAGEQRIEQSPLARDGWLRIATRALFYAALFFFAGGLINAALLAGRRPAEWLFPPGLAPQLEELGSDPELSAERQWARTIDAGWLALVAGVAVALVEAVDASGGARPAGMADFLLSSEAGLARVGAAASLAVAVPLAKRLPRAAVAWVALTFAAISLSGHANSADPRVLALLTDWVHLLAGAVWIGGIAQIALAWLPALGRLDRDSRLAVIRSVLERFGRVALPAFLVVLPSGLANAVVQLGHPEALWQTAYGRLLSLKLTLVALIALASYAHALRLRPRLLGANPHPRARRETRHWRLLAMEPWLGLAVVVAAAALVAFPLPPRQLGEAGDAEAEAACDPCPLPKAREGELAIAEQAGPNIAAFRLRRAEGQVKGTMRLLDFNTKPVDASVEVEGGSAEGCGEGCWRLAAPAAGASVRVGVEADEDHQFSLPVRWRARKSEEAERLLVRAQDAMRSLHTVRMRETLTSGLGPVVRSGYRFQAPNRMAYRTSSGTRLVALGGRRYSSIAGAPFEKGRFGADGFQLDRFFRWTIYGRSVNWLGASDGVAKIALFDQATPVWYRLTIERRSGRILEERMIAGGHFMNRRYLDFNRPLSIAPPR